MYAIPPKTATLVQHTVLKRATYAYYCWGKMLRVSQNLPLPEQWNLSNRKDKFT